MFLIILVLIFSNIIVLKYDVNATLLLLILSGGIGLYKGVISEKLSDIFNITSFKYTLKNKENKLELLGAFLITLIIFRNEVIKIRFRIVDIFGLVICTLFIYRFLFFNLSIGNRDEKMKKNLNR